jgi:hypothetical protein
MDQQYPGEGGPTPAWSPSAAVQPQAERPVRPRTPVDRVSDLDRPVPTIASLGGAVAAILLGLSLTVFLGALEGDNRRVMGIVLSLAFEVVGLAIVWLAKGRRMASAGLGLSAIGIVPLVTQVFFDPSGSNFESASDFTSTVTVTVGVLGILWLIAYFLGPGRRYALYLGAALFAFWLAAIIQIFDGPLSNIEDELTSSFETSSEFTEVSPEDGTEYYYETGDDFTYEYYEDDYSSSSDPTSTLNKLGVVSLLYGGAYLAIAGFCDRRGNARAGTACLAAAIPILHFAVWFLALELEEAGTGVLALVLGAIAIYLGVAGGRRFTSWTGVYAAAGGIGLLVDKAVGESAAVSGVVLLVLGLGLAALLYGLEPGTSGGRAPTSPLPMGPTPGTPVTPAGPHTWTEAQPTQAPPPQAQPFAVPPTPPQSTASPFSPTPPTPPSVPPPADGPPPWPPTSDPGGA